VSVPEILARFIPEILARLRIPKSDKGPLCTGEAGSRGRRMSGMLKRDEIEILLKAGHSKAEVARG
jgi:hypothetical protein